MGLPRLGPEKPTTAGLIYQTRSPATSKRSEMGVGETYGESVALTVSISIAVVTPDAGMGDPGALAKQRAARQRLSSSASRIFARNSSIGRAPIKGRPLMKKVGTPLTPKVLAWL
jgi:hypothetical protein